MIKTIKKYTCEHGRQCKSRCSDCLKHNINKDKCSRCKKSYKPTINDPLKTCMECRKPTCEHGYKSKKDCKNCTNEYNNKYKCEHNKRKNRCVICTPNILCEHNILKEKCIKCTPQNLCIHSKRKSYCIICTPTSKYFCISCRLFVVNKYSNYLCSYCNPIKSKRVKTKELSIKALLEFHNIKFIHDKQITNECCLKYRPDFLIDCNSYYIVLEVDEDAHSSYDKECEVIRMNNIITSIGLPTKFIRYNPDNREFSKKAKEQKLIETILENMKKEYLEDLEPIYLFY